MGPLVKSAVFAALIAGTSLGVAVAPAQAASSFGFYFGTGPAYPFAGPYRGRDYACDDYYAPPWNYPPDYCAYDLWYDPVFIGGAWYNGPFYYRSFSGVPYFWVQGGWHRDEWRGVRPRYFDWGNGRNIHWSGAPRHAGHGADAFRYGSRRGGWHGWRH